MKVIKAVALALLQCIAMVMLFAQQPHLEIIQADSLTVPHSYDYAIQLSNNDIQFYKLNYGTSSIQINSFQYLSQINEFTALQNMGTTPNLDGLYPLRSYTLERFGNFYLVHKLESGLAVFKMDQNTLISRIINEFSINQYFDLQRLTEIVSENAIAIALADSLVYYNFMVGSSQTLLQGAEYQCGIQQYPTVIALPESHFMYVKDTAGGGQLRKPG